jgi:ribonucleoside-diphosphate reductase alpha chain
VRSNLYVLKQKQRSKGKESVARTASGATALSTGTGGHVHTHTHVHAEVTATQIVGEADDKISRIREARMKGYEGDSCGECGNFTLVRNGTCMKCDTCGATSGCS